MRHTAEIRPVQTILYRLATVTVLNWFLYFGISYCLGGQALDTLPSKDGFVLKSHGPHSTPVSEPAWVFSLIYGSATLLLTPLAFLLIAAIGGFEQFRLDASGKRIMGCVIAIWLIGSEWSIGSSAWIAARDWLQLRQTRAATAPPH
jgi:hypothetical protein